MMPPDPMHDETNDIHDLKWLAYWLARYLLRDKTDKQGKPLVEHSMRVATRCADAGLSDTQQIAAITRLRRGRAIEQQSHSTGIQYPIYNRCYIRREDL